MHTSANFVWIYHLLNNLGEELLNFSMEVGSSQSNANVSNWQLNEAIDKCHQFLDSRGIKYIDNKSELCCTASKAAIEELFQSELIYIRENSYSGYWNFSRTPHIPGEIREFVSQINFPPPPELF